MWLQINYKSLISDGLNRFIDYDYNTHCSSLLLWFNQFPLQEPGTGSDQTAGPFGASALKKVKSPSCSGAVKVTGCVAKRGAALSSRVGPFKLWPGEGSGFGVLVCRTWWKDAGRCWHVQTGTDGDLVDQVSAGFSGSIVSWVIEELPVSTCLHAGRIKSHRHQICEEFGSSEKKFGLVPSLNHQQDFS